MKKSWSTLAVTAALALVAGWVLLHEVVPDRSLVDAPNAIRADTASTATGTDAHVDAEQPAHRVSLQNEYCRLSVTALWHDGSRAAATQVRLSPRRPTGYLESRTRATDANGRVEFDALVPGPFVVRLDRGASARVELAGGKLREVELTVAQGVRTRSVVVVEDGQPVRGARIWMSQWTHDPEGGFFVARSDRDGHFELRDVVSDRTISAFAEGFRPATQVRIPKPGAEPHELRLEVGHAVGTLHGTVHGPDGPIAVGASVLVGELNPFAPIPVPPPLELVTDANGEFVATGLAETAQLWVRSVDSAVFHRSVRLVRGHGEIDVQLQRGAMLTGTVRDAHGPARGRLTALHDAIEIAGLTGPSWGRPTYVRAGAPSSFRAVPTATTLFGTKSSNPDATA